MDVHLYLSCYYVSHLSLWVFTYLEMGYYYLNMIIVMMEVFSMSLCTDVAFSVCFNNRYLILHGCYQFSSVQLLSHVQLFATPWTAACQASLSITNFQSPPKPMCIESVMPSSHLILGHPLLLLPTNFPSIRVFSNESALCIRWPKYWSFSFNISPSNELPGLISLEQTGWISLQSKGLSRVSSNTTVQKHQFFSAQLSLQPNSHIHTWPLEKPYPWLDGPLLAK